MLKSLRPVDKRRKSRTRTQLKAIIRVQGSDETLPCVVWDMSDGGAKLAPVPPAPLPNRFSLIFSGAVQRQCEIRWRDEDLVGVKFL